MIGSNSVKRGGDNEDVKLAENNSDSKQGRKDENDRYIKNNRYYLGTYCKISK